MNAKYAAIIALALALAIPSGTHAGTLYWDSDGTGAVGTPPTSGVGGAGTWDTSSAKWWNGSSYQTWTAAGGQDVADFRGTAGTVTVSGTVNVNKINIATGAVGSAYTISSGTVAFTGSPGIIEVTSTAGSVFSSGASGSLKLNATGNSQTVGGSIVAIISGATSLGSFELALNTDSNALLLDNAAGLGPASSTVKLTKGVLNLSGGSTYSFNAWATELAGGAVRGRYGSCTWNGATTLTANSMLMARNGSGGALTFSATATINLNANTLFLNAGASSGGGITLNGVISGAGSLALTNNNLGGSDGGLGTNTLGAANTFSGTATTTAGLGTLALNHVNALQNATLNTGASSGSQQVTFIVAGNNTYNIGALTGADDLALGGNTISVGSKAVDTTFSGVISGTGGLTKVGGNKLTLSGANSYAGNTTISAGTLSASPNSFQQTPLLTLAAGATLDVSTAGITLTGSSPQQTLAAGSNSGIASIIALSQTATLNSGALLSFQADGSGSTLGKLSVTGNLTLNANAMTVNVAGSALAAGTYRLLDCTGTLSGSANANPTITGITSGFTATVSTTPGAGGHVDLVVTASSFSYSAFRVYATSGSPAAGANDQLTIYTVNSDGTTNTSNSGDITLSFSGLNNAPGGAAPTVTDKTAAAKNFGQAATITFANGVSTAGGLLVAKKAETATVHVTDGTHTDQSTGGNNGASLTVSAGTASALAMQTQPPTTAVVNQPFNPQPVVAVNDTYGNQVTADSSTWVFTAATNTLYGTTNVQASGGLATFSGLYLAGAGTDALTFTTTNGLASVKSADLTVTQSGTCTATYNGNGNTSGTAPADPNSPYTAGATVMVLGNTGGLTNAGYVFAGWNTAANGTGTGYNPGNTFIITGNTTLYAVWTTNTTFSPLVIYADALASGWIQNGWTYTVDPANSSPVHSGAHSMAVTLSGSSGFGPYFTGSPFSTANYSALSFWLHGGVSGGQSLGMQICRAGTPVQTLTLAPLPANTWTNIVLPLSSIGIANVTNFNCFRFTSSAATPVFYADDVQLNGATAYTVTYNGNGNTGGVAPMDGNSPYASGATVTVLGAGSLGKLGYAFVGWNTAASGSGANYSPGNTLTLAASTTLFAQWAPSSATYTLTYSGNGNTGGTPPIDSNSPYLVGSTVTVLDNTGGLTNSGLTFLGWNTASNGSGTSYSLGSTFLIAANTTLYAQWNFRPIAPPPVTTGAPGPGKRVLVTPPEYAGTDVHHTLYLPSNWQPNGHYPVIIEFAPNVYGSFAGTVEDTQLGFYQSAGVDFIWVTMPSINYLASPMSDAIAWWGNGSPVDAAGQALCAQYVKTNLVRTMENYGGDPSSVFITGFSRGAIATGYIGLSSDDVADIWLAFLPHSHYDGGSFTPDPGNVRTSRIKGRASFITYGQSDSGAANSIIGLNNLTALGFPVEAYELVGLDHTDEWITDASTPIASSNSNVANVPDVRARLRTWLHNVLTNKPGTHSISGRVADDAGRPVAGARVQSGTHWTFTDQNGTYSLAGLVNGPRTLAISHPVYKFTTNALSVILIGANLTNQNFVSPAVIIQRTSRSGPGQIIIDFAGPANTTFDIRKSLTLSPTPFPIGVTPLNAPVTTDDRGGGRGVAQAIIAAADAAEPTAFFELHQQ